MTLFGRRDLWAIEVDPLPGPPGEPDPAAAATWCALRIWADGNNLTAHTRKGSSTTSETLHWPAAFLARWFVRSWPGFWERAGWPLPGTVMDAEMACRRLDRRLAELDLDAEEEQLDRRDAFVASHSLLVAAAGGLMPRLELPGDWTTSGALVDPARFSPAVVFRALTPVVTTDDVLALLDRLRSYPLRPEAAEGLNRLSGELMIPSEAPPHEQGYALAEQLRAVLGNRDDYFDIEAFLLRVGAGIDEIDLHDASVDGATVWSDDHGSVILVNHQSPWPEALWARRTALAHELCHLLVDRSAATELMVASTPWAPPEIERRANAFAAELLLPKVGILQLMGQAVHRGWVDDAARLRLMFHFKVGILVCNHQLENRWAIAS